MEISDPSNDGNDQSELHSQVDNLRFGGGLGASRCTESDCMCHGFDPAFGVSDPNVTGKTSCIHCGHYQHLHW
jgi:hypothetical protein